MKLLLIFLFSILFIGCNSAPPVANTNRPINAAQQSNDAKSVLAHSAEASTPRPVTSTNGKMPGAGGGDPIDTSKFDSEIATAEKELKAKPTDESAKLAAAEAYFARGFALTEARQYASALGDYRRAVKLVPDHEESKKWIDQIVGIYSMLKKEAPKEGAEPPPLPFKKAA